ncbi:hypothetical protein, partial [Streptomyces albipurpureus]
TRLAVCPVCADGIGTHRQPPLTGAYLCRFRTGTEGGEANRCTGSPRRSGACASKAAVIVIVTVIGLGEMGSLEEWLAAGVATCTAPGQTQRPRTTT